MTLRDYIHGAIPSLETRKNNVLSKLPKSFFSKTGSFVGASLKIRYSLHSNCVFTKRDFQCRSSVRKIEYKGVFDTEEDKPKSKITKKNLAVFVSGGGSNFRSIYEATLNGSIHGHIVALVTNKHGIHIIYIFLIFLLNILK